MPEAARVASGPELGRDVAHRALQRRLGDAHDVVVRHHHLAAVIRHGEHRAAVLHQWLGEMRHAEERPARHVHRGGEAFARHIDDAAAQRLLGREGDRVHQDVEPAPFLGDVLEHGLHLARLADVHRQEQLGVELVGERLDEPFGLLVEIGDRDVGAERAQPLGAAPGDRLVVGDADHEGLAAFEMRQNAWNGHAVLAFCSSLSFRPARSARV
jgi:hypothetical protein